MYLFKKRSDITNVEYSFALAMELLQFCTKPSKWNIHLNYD